MLGHPSAEVRTAALAGLVILDDPSAVPFLRAAAEKADMRPETTLEAVSLREAADILLAPRPPGEPKMPPMPLADEATRLSIEKASSPIPDAK